MTSNNVLIGKVVGTFGIKGELKISSESDFIEYRYRKKAVIYFDDQQPHKVTSFRKHNNHILITIDDLYDINQIIGYVGHNVYASNNDAPQLKEDEYFVDDLVNLEVYNILGEYLGIVNDVLSLPQGVVLEVKNQEQTFLVPFVKAFIKEVSTNRIVIEEIEGLR